MIWTTADDVISSWIGNDAPTDTDLVGVWVQRAERLLRRRIPSLTSRVDADESELLETIVDVVSNMVQRVFRNPEGIRQKNETTGPFSTQATYGGDQPGYLWVTDEELNSLTDGATGQQRAFSVDTMPSGAGSNLGRWWF